MSRINDFLTKRLRRRDTSPKVTALAKRSTEGSLNGFSGIFSITKLNENEEQELRLLLQEYASEEETNMEADLQELASLTSEVKAINNQAAILHGERIKKAYDLLIRYRDGAFTAWLMKTYGNRQTPYNFLHYYLFFLQIPPHLQSKFEAMPRQAIYTLATREGDLQDKQQIIESYEGQSKQEIIERIRDVFPLSEEDKRAADPADQLATLLAKAYQMLKRNRKKLSQEQKTAVVNQLDQIAALLEAK